MSSININNNIQNRHVSEYINYFINLEPSPQYALLLKGEWGSGKTWFINNFLSKNFSIKYLFVSLNGVSNFEEIEESFFQQLHPVLSSKGMRIASKLLKGLLKATIKFDLDSDGKKDDLSITASSPNINIPEYFNNVNENLLIFDDLERCSIPIEKILGYINQFVENNGLKVIILANEEEIVKKDEKRKIDSFEYLSIKEKVIGKTFTIQPNFDSAFDSFSSSVNNPILKVDLTTLKSVIKNQFELSKYNNLRHLKQAIQDLDRFYGFLPEKAFSNSELLNHIYELFFCICFELKKGMLKESDISKLFIFDLDNKSKNDRLPIISEIKSKYPIFSVYYHPINGHILEEFFKKGIVDREEVNESISNSNYFQEENTTNWIKLWHFYDLNDFEFQEISKLEICRFFKGEICEKHELIHITGLLFELSDKKLINKSKEEIFNRAILNIRLLKKKGLLSKGKYEDFPDLTKYSLQVQGTRYAEFREFCNIIKSESKNLEVSRYPDAAKNLLILLNSDIAAFSNYVLINNSEHSLYYNVPIFQFMNPKVFVKILLNLSNKDKKFFRYILEKRYGNNNFFNLLISEVDWWVKILNILMRRKRVGKISKVHIKDSLIPFIQDFVNRMNTFEDNPRQSLE